MAKDPAVERESGTDAHRVWGQVTIKVNLGDYQSGEVSLGESRPAPVDRKERKAMRRQLLDDLETDVERKAQKLRKIWAEMT